MEREELIDKYLHSTLTPSESEQFNSLLKNDNEFREDVELFKNLKVVSGAEDRAELRKNLVNFETKIATKKTKVVPLFNYKKIMIAASIVLIATIGGITLFNPFGVDADTLYAANFEPYKNVVTPIVRGETNENDEVEAFISYESKDYISAANQFRELYETTKLPYFLLYQANSLLASGNVKEAIPILEQHVALNDELSERGKWYLSLAYIKENKKEEAITLLEEMKEKNSFKTDDVKQLLDKLR